MSYTQIPSNPFTVPGSAAGFLDIRKRGTTGPVVTVAVPAYAAGSGGGTPGQPIDVFVVSGQSNAEGATLQDGSKSFSRFRIYNYDTDAIEALAINGLTGNNMGGTYPSGRLTSPFFGPEDGMATYYEANNASPATAVLIKYAYGGATIEQFMTGGIYRARLDAAVNNGLARLVAQGFTPTIRAIYWNQWEGNQGESTASYQGKLSSLFQSFSWLPAAAKQVIMLANTDIKPVAVGVRSAQLNYISGVPNARYVDPLGRYVYQTTAGNDVHYDLATMRLSGTDFWDAYNRPSNALPGQTGASPTITSLSKSKALPGETIDINGANFAASNLAITITGVTVTAITYVNSSLLRVVVPQGVSIGLVRVTNPNGGTASAPGFVGWPALAPGAGLTKTNASDFSPAQDGALHTAMDSTPLPANVDGAIVFYYDPAAQATRSSDAILGFNDVPTAPNSFDYLSAGFVGQFDAGSGSSPFYPTVRNGSGGGVVVAGKVDIVTKGYYGLTRKAGVFTTVFYPLDGTGQGILVANPGSGSAGAVYAGISIFGNPNAQALDVRRSFS